MNYDCVKDEQAQPYQDEWDMDQHMTAQGDLEVQ